MKIKTKAEIIIIILMIISVTFIEFVSQKYDLLDGVSIVVAGILGLLFGKMTKSLRKML